MAEQELHLYFDVLQTLERLKVPYVVIGAFAGAMYGVTRTTFDVDIVVDLTDSHIDALAAAYPLPRFYADPRQMRRAIQEGSLFNIIDSSEGRKVDLIPLSMKPGYGWALEKRIRQTLSLPGGSDLHIWVARPEHVIVGKLMAWKESRSLKHEQDILDILTAARMSDHLDLAFLLDIPCVDEWSVRLGQDVLDLWHDLKDLSTREDPG